jgi:acyl-CoA thioesterase FadM
MHPRRVQVPACKELAVPAELSAPVPVRLHADEAGGHGRLTTHAALRYFERHRTGFIGGPDALAGLQAAGINVVVARLMQGRLHPAASGVWIGDPLVLRCRVTLRAKGTQVLFEQFLFTEAGELAAGAAVTCLCIDPIAAKMVAAPADLQAQLMEAMAVGR